MFASADTKNMDKAADAKHSPGDPVNFATNTLTIVAAPGNPKKIASFKDLAAPGFSVVLVCAPQVPCGSAAEKVEKATGVQLNPVSEESQVTDVLGKVTSGQADAGLVYVTDAQGAGDKVTAVVPRIRRCRQHLSHRSARAVDAAGAGAQVRRPRHRRGWPEGAERGGLRQAVARLVAAVQEAVQGGLDEFVDDRVA